MAVNDLRYDPGQILQPFQPSPFNRRNPTAMGASLAVSKGQAMGKKLADDKCYPLNLVASDGTQTFAGFSEYSFGTDANGLVYLTFGGTSAGPSYEAIGSGYASLFTGGIFNPLDVTTSPATGTPTAEVDTITPGGSPTTGDIYTVSNPAGVLATFTVGATQTAAAVVTGLKLDWNANPDAVALGAVSGSGTFIVTAANKGVDLNLQAGVAGTGTVALVITTAAVAAQQAEVDTFTPGGSVTTGDVWTLTINYPNGTTHAVTSTVGATATAAAISGQLIAAWNADSAAANLATASGTATIILTGVLPGNALNITAVVVGTGTVSKSVTKPAYGANFADIQSSRPGAYILPNGCWMIP